MVYAAHGNAQNTHFEDASKGAAITAITWSWSGLGSWPTDIGMEYQTVAKSQLKQPLNHPFHMYTTSRHTYNFKRNL